MKENKIFKEHVILETDKNQGPAIMERTDHDLWIKEYLGNINLYRIIDKELIKLCLSRIRDYFYKWPSYAKWFDTSNEKFGKFYGLPKIHKKGFPINKPALRPIVSIKNSILEKVSGYLHEKLWPIAKKTYSFIKDSRDLSIILKNTHTNPKTNIYTIDITDLYNNINLITLYNVIQNYVKKRKDSKFLLETLKIILDNNYFTYKDIYYRQIKGIPMGHPVAPALATLYLAFFEDSILENYKDKILIYKRYLDDVIIVTNENIIDCILDECNKIPNLTWNITSSNSSSTPFLDLLIIKENNHLRFTTFDKPDNLFAYPRFDSCTPKAMLKGYIKGMFIRYTWQNPRKEDFKAMIQKFFNRLTNRGYPSKWLKKIFKELIILKNNNKIGEYKGKKLLNLIKIQYDPRFKTKSLRSWLKIRDLENTLKERITFCYKKSPNILQISDKPFLESGSSDNSESKNTNLSKNTDLMVIPFIGFDGPINSTKRTDQSTNQDEDFIPDPGLVPDLDLSVSIWQEETNTITNYFIGTKKSRKE